MIVRGFWRMTLALAIAAVVSPLSSASAAHSDWVKLSRAIAAPWPAQQQRNGHFNDYVLARAPGPARDDYGDGMLGYALLRVGLRDSNSRLIDAGLRGITYFLGQPTKAATATFRDMALASAYNLARKQLSDDPRFVAAKPKWERALRSIKPARIVPGQRVLNKTLVEVVGVLELARSGLRSGQAGTVLNDPAAAVSQVKAVLRKALPAAARPYVRGDTGMIGDFPELPLAYHALAAAFLARAVELLGDSAPTGARVLLRRAANASLALAAPDGDVTYVGRSQAQAWSLPFTAYSAESAARAAGAGSTRKRAYRALAERAVARLRSLYRIGDEGLLVTPALSRDLDAGVRGLDPYAHGGTYNGLTMIGLDWAARAAAGRSPGDGLAGRRPERLGTARRRAREPAHGASRGRLVRRPARAGAGPRPTL